jgi:hypothetical protein
MARKLDPKVAEEVMLRAGLQPLEPYTSAHVNWRCECLVCGSIVTPTYATVQSKGAGCKTCRYIRIRQHHVLTIENVVEEVKKRGGKLISTEYVNTDTPLTFQCSLGHSFEMRFSHVKRGQWCPTCNKGSKSEEIARTTFEQIFGEDFPKKRPDWLKNVRGFRMEIDGYCEKLQIGFEYQGYQHFSESHFSTDLAQRTLDDEVKRQLCSDHGIALFILTHEMKYEEFPSEIAKQANDLGIVMPANWECTDVNIYNAFIREDRIEELREILGRRLIEVVSPKYLGSNEYVEVQCLICRHNWKAKGNAFFNSRKTAGCDKCARRRSGLLQKLSIEDLKDFAKANGGEVKSTEYIKRNYWYVWSCHLGHQFEGNFNNMVFRKQFCPICEGRKERKRRKV